VACVLAGRAPVVGQEIDPPAAGRAVSEESDQARWNLAAPADIDAPRADGGPAQDAATFVEPFDGPRSPLVEPRTFGGYTTSFGTMDAYFCGLGRAQLIHDQRIEFTGQESTFGVEGQLCGRLAQEYGASRVMLDSQLFLNQPFDRNILVDYPLRESFSHNFDIEPLEISQLVIAIERGAWYLGMGRFVTPFGRYYGPTHLNSFADLPFLRSEAILPRETGLVATYQPGALVLTAALVNGGLGRDTNSSKALVARVGWDTDAFVAGASIKAQDGIGSEIQKEYNNHVGLDWAVRPTERWIVWGEIVYDQYGMRHPGFDLDDITWGRSLYNRQLNRAPYEPLTGWGWYANSWWCGERWDVVVGFGQFFPDPIGDAIHDADNHRFLGQLIRHVTPHLDWATTVLLENSLDVAFADRPRGGLFLVTGFEFEF